MKADYGKKSSSNEKQGNHVGGGKYNEQFNHNTYTYV